MVDYFDPNAASTDAATGGAAASSGVVLPTDGDDMGIDGVA